MHTQAHMLTRTHTHTHMNRIMCTHSANKQHTRVPACPILKVSNYPNHWGLKEWTGMRLCPKLSQMSTYVTLMVAPLLHPSPHPICRLWNVWWCQFSGSVFDSFHTIFGAVLSDTLTERERERAHTAYCIKVVTRWHCDWMIKTACKIR